MHARVLRWRWLSLALLVALMWVPSYAGSVSLAWDPVSGASGYRVYYGTSSGQYTQNVNVGSTTQATITGLGDCTNWFLAVKAYNTAGESAAFSNEVVGWPRPRITAASPNARMQGEQFTIDITGSNFQPGARIEDLPNNLVTFASESVVNCNRIQAVATIEPTSRGVRPAQVGQYQLTVLNPDQVYGSAQSAFQVLINPARFDAVLQPATPTQGRIDGWDWNGVFAAFASQLGDPNYSYDLDFNGDGAVDGQEVSFLRAVNVFGRCWSGVSWTITACPAGAQ